jgi:methionyl-tRNA formyltransferase
VTRAVVFAYSEVGVRCVGELLAQGVDIPLLFTHVDDPAETRWFDSVAALAHRHALRAETPDDPNLPHWVEEGRRAAPDFLFSFYYRHLLSGAWLKIASRGALNMHGSLLPKYRGRAPVHWAIIHGESVTGASLHYMVDKPDAGDLVDQQAVPILENDTALDVSVKVAGAAVDVLRRSLPALIAGTAEPKPLDLSQGSYFGRRRPEDGRIDWRRPARSIHDLVRAVAPPFPGAFTDVNGCRLAVLATRLGGPAQHARGLPCLYSSDDSWYADCIDGRRLEILTLALDQSVISPRAAPPALSNQPLALH